MKKFFYTFTIFLCFFLLSGCGYNGLIDKREAVEQQWANVENQYQKRQDLVPNLVATVKGYASHEEGVFTQIAEARSKLGGTVYADITDNPEKFEQFQNAQNTLSASLGRLLALTENYPDLKANEQFLDLQSQLEGIENRISTERKRYNDSVGEYNKAIQKFPGVVTAKIFGFTKKAYFHSDEAAAKAPVVSF
ncbi:LemA family protein [Treponema sp.]|uniref:LemA family protein n=1 Tax=Treponema sp. TaxID=166 RepID=UPI003F093788